MQQIFNDLRKDLGTGKVFKASEAPEVEVISTGSVSLDFATGVGGFPKGTIIEVFGRESVGKTALAYKMIEAIHKWGGYAAFINLEGRFDSKWAKTVAPEIDLDKTLVIAPNPGTEAVEVLAKIVNSGSVDLAIFDSIGAMVGDKEQGPGNAKQAGGQSALVTHMVKMIAVPAYQNKCTVVFLNQVRDVFESMYKLEESPGGHAAKHMASVRVHLKPGKEKIEGTVNNEKVQIMFRVAAKIKKNKVGAPGQMAGWNFWNYESPEGIIGIDTNQEILDLAMKLGVIQRMGGWYSHPTFPGEKNMIQGATGVSEFLHSEPAALEQVRQELMKLADNGGTNYIQETLI